MPNDNLNWAIPATKAALLRIVPVVLIFLLAAGCGSSEKKIETVPVSGTVTLDGKPLPAALVTLHPTEGKANPCSATSNEQGEFKLSFGSYPGVMPGAYKVTIEYLTKPDGKPIVAEPGMDAMQLKMQGLAIQALPPVYSDLSQTKLTAKVEPGVDVDLDYALTSTGT